MPNWTKEQLRAIETGGGDLLVSAAAGSGKTAVLVERVLRRLTDRTHPADIDRFLLVTYTNAAAAEMRGKLADAITARLAEQPDDARLRRQLLLVHKAQITTVHAFCLGLVREQAAGLGLPPDFRLLDESERSQIADEVLDEVLEAGFASDSAGFDGLCELLLSGQSDAPLRQAVRELFEKTRAHADPSGFLAEVRDGLSDPADPGQTACGRVLLDAAREAAAYGLAFVRRALALLETDETLQAAYAPALTHDAAQAEGLLAAIAEGWDSAVAAAQAITFDRLAAVRGYEDKDFQEQIKGLRDEWKKAAGEIREKLLCVTAAQAAEDRALVRPALETLIDLTEAFSHAFSAEKLRRGACDFNDLEHFAVRLLYEGDAPSALAERLAAGFDEVLVDEYQDTNGVQDAIFRAVSRGNLFLVGDVKQSIYGFRLADPSIFLEKYRTFADEPAPGAPGRVILSRNFRSRVEVLDLVNGLFSAVMSPTVGDLEYTDREALHPGAEYPPAAGMAPELLLTDTADGGEEENADRTEIEARVVAERIRALLDSGFRVHERDGTDRPATASDVVILMRSPRARAGVYRAALERVGLRVRTEESSGLLGTAEVGTIVSLLAVLDNPRQDIDLIGVLRSPLFGFSEEALARIRLTDRKVSFYDALQLAGETDAQAAAFLETLHDLRALACDLPVYRLLWEVYDRTGALGLFGALPEGGQRQRNLLAFFERARAFEASGARGLFAFVRLLRGMLERGEDFQTIRPEGGEGAVRILSIHKSKGLEFPIVVVADLARRFNESDLTRPVLIHPSLGLGAKCRDLERGVRYDTLERQAVACALRRQAVSEELRVLYVALTRPKEKLILSCTSGTLATTLARLGRLAALDRLPPYAMGSARSFVPWVLTPLLRHPGAGMLRAYTRDEIALDADAPAVLFLQGGTAEACEVCLPEPEGFADRPAPPSLPASFVYRYAAAEDIPAKLTATGLRQDFRAAEAAEETRPPRPAAALRRPDFDRTRTGLTPAERGTAHHLFLQFCDFEACAAGQVEAERQRLRDKQILSPEQADAVDPERIAAFFAHPLYRETLARGTMRREFKFSIVVPAERYYPEMAGLGERVLLQGVIDCMSEEEDGFVIVDFKTDRVTAAQAGARAAQYTAQLEAYAAAVGEIFGKPVKRRVLYFLQAGAAIDV